MSNIAVDELASDIETIIKEYLKETDDIMQDEIEKMSKEVADDLRNNSNIPERTGEYKKGFRIKKVAQGMGYKRNKVYNKKYQLTHLLEDGHKSPKGRAKAFPHWKKAQEIVETLPERIKERLEK